MSASLLIFNTTTAACQNVTESFRPTAEAALVESTFTRYSQKEVRQCKRTAFVAEQACEFLPRDDVQTPSRKLERCLRRTHSFS